MSCTSPLWIDTSDMMYYLLTYTKKSCFCRYELKDTQFHFEAGKNNNLLRTQDRWEAVLNSRSQELSRSQPDLSTLHMRSASFSWQSPHPLSSWQFTVQSSLNGVWKMTMTVKLCMLFFWKHFYTLYYPFQEIWVALPGVKATAATRTMLPSPTNICGVFSCFQLQQK